MSGKTYGPTYAVTSSSSGSSSRPGSSSPSASSGGTASSVTRRTLPGPHRLQLVVAGAQTLRQHTGFAHRGHEVGVAQPARQYMHVQMPWNARARGLTQVGAEVHAVGLIRGPDRA